MQNRAGWWLRGELRELTKRARQAMSRAAIIASLFTGIGFGLLIAALLHVALSYSSLRWHYWPFLILAGIFVVLSAILSERAFARDRRDSQQIGDKKKGRAAETRIGDSIDYAIVARGCAVAHNVEKIPEVVGDIDHIVLTPTRRLWVVETKSRRVPPSEFSKVLDRIAANVEAVRKWEPKADVQGYLALASDDKFRGMPRRARGEKILVGGRDLLLKKLRDEARAQRDVDDGLVQRVWDLGKKED